MGRMPWAGDRGERRGWLPALTRPIHQRRGRRKPHGLDSHRGIPQPNGGGVPGGPLPYGPRRQPDLFSPAQHKN